MNPYVGHMIQKVNLAFKAKDINAAQNIAYHRWIERLSVMWQQEKLNDAALLEQLSMVEVSLSEWKQQTKQRGTGTIVPGVSF